MEKLRLWVQQPTSVTGLAAILGTLSALMTNQLSWAQALPVIIGAVVSILLPDNTRAKTGAETVTDGIVTIFQDGPRRPKLDAAQR